MATATLTQPAAPPSPMRSFYRFTVDQYHRMIDAGILTENDRVELLDGWIIGKMTHKPPHDTAVDLAQSEIAKCLPEEWRTRTQSAITLPGSEPEPDVAVVRGPARRYTRSHPRPKDIGVLVEVADSSLEYDRSFKGTLYARARIPVYWIINLIDSRIEVYTQPRPGKAACYQRRQDFGMDESVPLIIDGRKVGQIAVRDVLP